MLGWQVSGAELGRRFLQHRYYSRRSRLGACRWLPSNISVDRSAQRVAREHNMKQNIACSLCAVGKLPREGLEAPTSAQWVDSPAMFTVITNVPVRKARRKLPSGLTSPPPPLIPSSRQCPLLSFVAVHVKPGRFQSKI